ncbi:S1 RNA-binding domain-containing protein [Streptomyces sp. NPDC051130]
MVSSLVNFGAFVDLGGCVDGLVNVSEVSWRPTATWRMWSR